VIRRERAPGQRLGPFASPRSNHLIRVHRAQR
jgi:hypothetical protein